MTEKDDHYRLLLAQTPRTPSYLGGSAALLAEQNEAAANKLSTFLYSPICLGACTIRRQPASKLDTSLGEVFDILDIVGKPVMRMTVSADTVSRVTKTLFGGEVMERPVLSGIALAFCRQIAGTYLHVTELASANDEPSFEGFGMDGMDEDEEEEEKDPLDGYTLAKAEEETLCDRPVLRLDLNLSLVEPPDLNVILEFPRYFTDQLQTPDGALGDHVLSTLSFPVTAIAGSTVLPFGEIRDWKPGDEIQLPGASLETVEAMVSVGTSKTTIALAELGAEDGDKCLRIAEVLAKSEEPALDQLAV